MFPKISIIGRQNVGKSSLFNLLAHKNISITHKLPGVTRDRVETLIDNRFILVDTGGFPQENDIFEREILENIQKAIEESDCLVLLTDVRDGVTPFDLEIAKKLKRIQKQVILAVNKADNQRFDLDVGEFYKLGLGDPIRISVTQRRGIDDLLESIEALLPQPVEKREPALKIAIVGKRNVGKSTLVNTIVGENRVIVSDIAGTTRDAVDILTSYQGLDLLLIDTAGLVKRYPNNPADLFSQVRTQKAIKRADCIIFIVDATNLTSKIDKQVADEIYFSRKPCVIALNKWDLVPKGSSREKFMTYFKKMISMNYAPMVPISAKTGQNVIEAIKLCRDILEQAGTKIARSLVNKITDALKMQAPFGTAVLFGEQKGTRPITIIMNVKNRKGFPDTFVKFAESKVREITQLNYAPIRLIMRDPSRKKLGG